jgi:hypothetical protein
LWSKSSRWRESIRVGDTIEVRDSSSLASRPKWYHGVVRLVGQPSDPIRSMQGGAELETYDFDGSAHNNALSPKPEINNQRMPLLILGRTQQILVQVEQELVDKRGAPSPKNGSAVLSSETTLIPNPPSLRWVYLYGEEVARTGTHLKVETDPGPVTLRYEYEGNRNPVEIMKGHPMFGSGFLRESLRGSPPAPGVCGLHQLGNSCFLNSTV